MSTEQERKAKSSDKKLISDRAFLRDEVLRKENELCEAIWKNDELKNRIKKADEIINLIFFQYHNNIYDIDTIIELKKTLVGIYMIKKFEKMEENGEYLIAVDKPYTLRYFDGQFFRVDSLGGISASKAPAFILDSTAEHIDKILGTNLVEQLDRTKNCENEKNDLASLLGDRFAFCSEDELWYSISEGELEIHWMDDNYKTLTYMAPGPFEDMYVFRRLKSGALKIKTREEIRAWVKKKRAEYLKEQIDDMSKELAEINDSNLNGTKE